MHTEIHPKTETNGKAKKMTTKEAEKLAAEIANAGAVLTKHCQDRGRKDGVQVANVHYDNQYWWIHGPDTCGMGTTLEDAYRAFVKTHTEPRQ